MATTTVIMSVIAYSLVIATAYLAYIISRDRSHKAKPVARNQFTKFDYSHLFENDPALARYLIKMHAATLTRETSNSDRLPQNTRVVSEGTQFGEHSAMDVHDAVHGMFLDQEVSRHLAALAVRGPKAEASYTKRQLAEKNTHKGVFAGAF
jgi:hypothetical protein